MTIAAFGGIMVLLLIAAVAWAFVFGRIISDAKARDLNLMGSRGQED